MRAIRWPLVGMIVAGSLAFGSCAGALAGHFTVTGGLYPDGGWQMPSYGVEQEIAALPPAAATVRAPNTPQFVGYYPAQASDVPQPIAAEAAARDYDALYDQPAYADASYAKMDHEAAIAATEAGAAAPARSEPETADIAVYRGAEAAEAVPAD
jgi:hypothetical protein